VQYERGSDHSVCSVQGEWLLSMQCKRGSGHSVCSVSQNRSSGKFGSFY